MKNLKRTALGLSLLLTSLLSCKSDVENPAPANEEEVITTMILHFTQAGTTNSTTAQYRDKDGEGPLPATIDEITLKKGIAYNFHVSLLNESGQTPKDISTEVKSEGNDHQFFFDIAPTGLATVSYADADNNKLPIGLNNTFTTSASTGSGSLKVTLKHMPGLKTSTSTVNTGETDIEQNFVLKITE